MKKIQKEKDCIFCKIVDGEESAEIVHESTDFLVIKNKYPDAPVHLLVIPKKHIVKQQTLYGKSLETWPCLMRTVYEAVKKENLKDNYQLLINGIGMGHFHHEHIHIIAKKDLLAS
jgi:histidine triad (HIT) family protein